MMTAESSTLAELFHHVLEHFEAPTRSCIDAASEAYRRVNSLSLFNDNESLCEVSTLSLRYMIVPVLYGLSLLGMPVKEEQGDRRETLRRVKLLLSEFRDVASNYGVTRKVTPGGGKSEREQKIARFRELKALEESLAVECDDRDAAVIRIRIFLVRCGEAEQLADRELALLETQSQPIPERCERPSYKPFVLTRSAAASGVFRPSHRLPTMTVEEFLRLEAERGNIISSQSVIPTHPTPPSNEAEEAELVANLLRARAFDAFKDVTPRGSGNTHNKS